MKQLYERYFYDMKHYANESFWCVCNRTVKIRLIFASFLGSEAVLLTRNGDWTYLDSLKDTSATCVLWHKYDGDEKTAPPAEIIAAFKEDTDELLRLCGLLLDGGVSE